MNIEAGKLSFLQEFLKVQSEEIVILLEKLLKEKKSEQHKSKLKSMSLEQFNNEIDQSLVDSDNEMLIKASELKDKWN